MTIAMERPLRLGFVPANRGFFSSKLAAEMREQTIEALEALGIEVVVPDPEQTNVGCVQNREEAIVAGRLLREADVDGIIVGAVNFGDEQAAALTVREARLDVPVLIFGCQEEAALSRRMSRRDAFCGLFSIGEVLRQIGVKYSIGRRPISIPSDASSRTTSTGSSASAGS